MEHDGKRSPRGRQEKSAREQTGAVTGLLYRLFCTVFFKNELMEHTHPSLFNKVPEEHDVIFSFAASLNVASAGTFYPLH